jgi:hypothetical protein
LVIPVPLVAWTPRLGGVDAWLASRPSGQQKAIRVPLHSQGMRQNGHVKSLILQSRFNNARGSSSLPILPKS